MTFNFAMGAGMTTVDTCLNAQSSYTNSIMPDFVILSEVDRNTLRNKCQDKQVDQALELAKKKLMDYYYFGRSPNILYVGEIGTAVLSRYPIIERKIHEVKDGDQIILEIEPNV